MSFESLESRRLLAIDLQVRFEFASPQGNPVGNLHIGDDFFLNVYVRDIRNAPAGIFQAFLDVNYPASLASTNGAITHGASYNANPSGNLSTPGLVDDAGAVDTDQFAPAPAGTELLLFSVPFHADSAGQFKLTPGLAANPNRQIVKFDIAAAVPLSDIQFVGDTIDISAAPVPRVSIASTQQGNEAGPVNGLFTVSQSVATGSNTVIQYTVAGTATSGSDFTPLSGTATILAGQTTTTISVPVLNDAVVEDSETVIVTLDAISQGDPAVTIDQAAKQATVSIADNDAAQVSIATTTGGNEAGPVNGRFTVTQSAVSSTNTVISFSVGGSATSASDYSAIPSSVTIVAGNTTATIDVPVINDALLEGPETVMVTLNSITSGDPQIALQAGSVQAALTIVDNDTAQVRVATTTPGNEAGPVNGVFTVTQTAASPTNTVVTFAFSGTATGGTDYTGPSGTVTIAAGATSATITVAVTNDLVVEADETVIVTLGTITSGGSQVSIDPAQTQASLTIADNDTAQVRIAKTTDGSEAGPANGVFTVTQTAASSTATVVSYTVTGTATAGNDFSALSGNVTIAAGATTATISVPVLDDSLAEASETVIVTLSAITGGDPQIQIDTGQSQATVQIADNEAPVVRIAKTTDANEAGLVDGRFTVSQTIVTATATIVSYSVAGTATSASDFTPLSGTVTIPAGQVSAVIDLDVLDDQLVEGVETLVVTLTQITQGNPSLLIDAANAQATVSIADNETGLVGIASTNDGSEAGPISGLFTVTQNGISAVDTVISYAVAGTATMGADYTALSGSVTIPAGQTSATITVPVLNDTIVEPNETVVITLNAITSGSPLVSVSPQQGQATLGVVDNDAAQVRVDSATGGSETGPTGGVIAIVQTAASATDTVIQFSIAGTATNGADYTALSGTVTILAGQTSATINVSVLEDLLVEAVETVTIALVSLQTSGAAVTIDQANASGIVEIVDNDTALASIVKTSDGSEANLAPVVFTVSLSAASSTETVIQYTLGGMATSGSDYTSPSLSVTIPAGSTSQTISLATIDDVLIEGSETVNVTLTAITSGDPDVNLNENADSAAGEIADDETGRISITAATAGSEAGPAPGLFILSQSGITEVDTVIAYTVSGTATSGEDFVALSGTVTILAGQTGATLGVTVLDDALIEGAEALTVTLTEITSGDERLSLDPAGDEATLAISDDDTGLVRIALGLDASETGPTSGAFVVSQSGVANVDTVVSYTIAGTAAAGSDFALLTGTVTIPAGQTAVTIVINPIDDSIVENAETVVVTLTGIVSGSSLVAVDDENDAATLAIADNDAAQVSVAATSGGNEAGAVAGVFTVTQTAVSSTDTILTYTVAGTATAGSDYTALSGTVTIPAGQTSATVNIPVINDLVVEGTETVTLTLSNITSGGADVTINASQDDASLQIADNDNATISFATAASSVVEMVGSHTVIVRLSLPAGGTLGQSVTVNVATTGGTASEADFSLTTTSVTFAAGSGDGAQHTVTLAIVDDDVVEVEETVVLGLSLATNGAGGSAAIGGIPSHTVGIIDDPGSGVITGSVWADTNFNGARDGDEMAIPDVVIRLVGVNSQGQHVEQMTKTDTNGGYGFSALSIGTYEVIEEHPAAFNPGDESLGSLGGAKASDHFSEIKMTPGGVGTDYNFREGGLQAQYVTVRNFLATTPKHDFILRDTIYAAQARSAALRAAQSLATLSEPTAAPQVDASLVAQLTANAAPEVAPEADPLAAAMEDTQTTVDTQEEALASAASQPAPSAVPASTKNAIPPVAADASIRAFLASSQAGPLVEAEPDLNAVAFAAHAGAAGTEEESLSATLQLDAGDVPDEALADDDIVAMLLEDPAGDRGIAGGPVDDEQAADQAFDDEESWLDQLLA